MIDHKGSRFNIAVPLEGDVLLYNTATGALLRVDPDTHEALAPLFQDGSRGVPRDWAPPVPEDLDEDLAGALTEGGFVVAREVDELGVLRSAFERERTSPDLKFTIGLTMACNFACPYCFEEHRNEHMSMAAADATFTFIQAQMRAAQATSVYVNWFGGEPLLNLDVLCHLSRRLRDEAAATGAYYESLVITNGALLTRAVAEQLRAAGVEAAQVTLDGPAAVHDQRRPFKGGQGSFDRILANLRETTDVLRTIVRVNVDQGNHASQRELVRVLADAKLLDGPHAARIYAGKVTAYTEQSEMLWTPLDQRAIGTIAEPIAAELGAL
ncbi:MAG: radical SAM protein, partial [Myxococcales bacterium]|nr:radical SAM protein [Myxococcales bacterium]